MNIQASIEADVSAMSTPALRAALARLTRQGLRATDIIAELRKRGS